MLNIISLNHGRWRARLGTIYSVKMIQTFPEICANLFYAYTKSEFQLHIAHATEWK